MGAEVLGSVVGVGGWGEVLLVQLMAAALDPQGGGLEGGQPVDLSKHPSGIVPTLQYVSLFLPSIYYYYYYLLSLLFIISLAFYPPTLPNTAVIYA